MDIDANDELESSESDEDDEEDFDEDFPREDDDEESGGDPNVDSVMADTEDAEYNTGVDQRKDDPIPSTSRPRVKHSSFKAAAMMPVPAAEKVRSPYRAFQSAKARCTKLHSPSTTPAASVS